ncbi:aminodeoxychorismate synthase, component I [Bacillus tianshenii]|nr:aminodeoxychorismate synthase, component I [Bacillus tianshenii]
MQKQRRTFAKKIPYDEAKWFKQYQSLSASKSKHILLESGRAGRYSIAALEPFAVLKGKDNSLSITTSSGTEVQQGNPLHCMREWMQQYQSESHPEFPDFRGGAVGFISYDYARYVEKLPNSAEDDLNTPDLYFLVFNDVFVYDHVEKVLWLMTNDKVMNEQAAYNRLEAYESIWRSEEVKAADCQLRNQNGEASRSFSQEAFEQAVRKVQAYISAGDVFQVNLAVRETRPLKTSSQHIYEKLRELNPSPYMGYLHFDDMQIVSASPELLVKKKGRHLSTRPIAGTRSRGKDEAEDEALAAELIHNEKERAEHVMLVDLERNDLGRVSEFGSVHVDEFMVIEKYSHVMHIVSNVCGTLAEGKDSYDVIEAVFPGGTITGAPKVRTMEIIEELESVRRGIYTGSIGWIGFDGEMELNIVIRTLIAKDGLAHVQAGAGIVIDSIPSAEYKESLKKAKALWRAKELSEEELMEKSRVEVSGE